MNDLLNDKFSPVPHTKEDDVKLFADPAFKLAWDALEEEYSTLNALFNARKESGLTQAEIAARMGTTTSAVSRLESSLRSERHSPSFETLRKYARACGKRLVVRME